MYRNSFTQRVFRATDVHCALSNFSPTFVSVSEVQHVLTKAQYIYVVQTL